MQGTRPPPPDGVIVPRHDRQRACGRFLFTARLLSRRGPHAYRSHKINGRADAIHERFETLFQVHARRQP